MEVPLRIAEAKAYLEAKYHESFELYSSLTIGLNQPYCELFFQSASHPEVMVKVYDDYERFSDDYYGVLVRDQMRQLFDRVAEGLPCEIKMFFRFQADAFPEDFSDAASFPDYLAAHPRCFSATMSVFSEAARPCGREVWDALCSRLRKEHVTGSLKVYPLDRNDYLEITADTYEDYLSAHYALPVAYDTYIR